MQDVHSLFKVFIINIIIYNSNILNNNNILYIYIYSLVNPTSLDSGFHFTEILAYNTESEANPLFK